MKSLMCSSVAVGALLGLTGCAALDSGTTSASRAPPAVSPESAAQTEAMRPAHIYVYPAKGQSPEQLDRDRYECYLWAVDQTGFDPSQPALAPHQRIEVVAAPPGADAVAGAVAGAVIGAVVSSPRHTGSGAIAGAVIGGVLGSASDTARAQEARDIQRRQDALEAERYARIEQQSQDYRRAISACLEGRGYTVK